MPRGNHNQLAFLLTSFGEKFASGNSFANAFRDWCVEASLPPGRRSPHGLRKAACRQLAEQGRSVHEIQAISGHITLAEIARYTRAVDQRRLARSARAKPEQGLATPRNQGRQNGL
jgi:integrase